ncbi:acrosomal protein KIAA1210 isoform X2 [Hippoglossus hippoglossus]|uniref:acrosomal protein KIAA1210 isoform X2 n=1 Tax=Hippoglossus hippoglossus TaxID=8267 RepID=UPI00148C2AD4|nr:acrosomal protein KIAA1210 isoform X2 [Hippoglossus hippoglossus]
MEASSGDIEEGTEDIPGRKKSKLKSLRTRLFGRNKRTGGEENTKHSQSSSDITAEQGLGSEEDLVCSQGMIGSRALSHDSIFQADEVLTDTEPARVLSQENVHSKIKALQIKLQQQKMHLGPPPLVVPVRRPEDLCGRSEDDSSRDISGSDVTSQGGVCKTISQPSFRPLSPISKPALTKLVPQFPSHPLPPTVPSISPIIDSTLDFSSPAQFTPCLDTSAARHRMSVKPRNQRARTQKRLATTDFGLPSQALNNIDHPEYVEEEEQRLCAPDKVSLETEKREADTTTIAQHLPTKSPEVAPITLEEAPKSSGLTSSQTDPAPPWRKPSISSQVLRPKPQRPVDVTSSERPHSSFIESELKTKREGDSEIQVMFHDKRNTLKKTGMTKETSDQISSTSSSALASRQSSIQQQVKDETESIRGIKRSGPGSGSFHFSITTAKKRDSERPRSSSFVGVLIQAEARHKSKGGTEEKRVAGLREKEELKDRVVGRLKQEGSLRKGSGITWDKMDSLKKTEPVASASKNAAADTGTSAKEEVESSREEVEEAVEAQEEVQEEEGKTAFGVKLRSMSQSMKVRADPTPNHFSKPPVSEDQCDKQNRQEMSDNVGYVSKKPLISSTPSTSGDIRVSDPTPSGSSLPLKNTLPSTGNSSITSAEVRATSSDAREVATAPSVPQEPQSAPAPALSEVSWMSLAMEKTRTLQQLFTGRFPRDLTGAQTVARPQAQVQPTTRTETQIGAQTQAQIAKMQQGSTPSQAANQPSSDTVKTATVQSTSQAQAVQPSLVSVQQNTTTVATGLSDTPKEAQTSKQTNEAQSHPSTTQFASQCLSHPPVQTKPWTPQFPLRSSTQADTSSQFALQGSATQCLAQSSSSQHATSQPPAWTNRGVHPTNQLKPTASVSTTTSITAPPPPVSALGKGERDANVQEKEGPSPIGRRAAWGGSVSERAAFLQKQPEWVTPAGAKEVELKNAQSEVQSSDESPVSANTTSLSTDTKPEGRPGVKLTESTPTKVPDRPSEDKWLRKNPASFSPSSSPTQSSELRSMSDSGKPSWMELAKRKSMAWSDKTMD